MATLQYFLFLFGIIFSPQVNGLTITSDHIIIKLEKYIRPKLQVHLSTCNLIVFSKNPTSDGDIVSTQHPVYTFSNKFPHQLRLKSSCNIIYIFIPTTNSKEYLEKIKNFIYKNFANIQLVIIFPKESENPLDYKYFAKILRKDVVVSGVSKDQITNLNHGLSFCRTTEPKCILQKRWVKVAYSEARPYFGLTKVVDQLPAVNITPESVDEIGELFSGVEFEMIRLLVKTYKMSFKFYPSSFGTQLPNGSWTGKLGYLDRGQVHMILGILPGNYRRGKVGRYSTQIFMTRFSLVSRRPGLLPSYQAPLRPFPFGAWIGLFLSVIIIGPLTFWISYQHHRIVPNSGKFTETLGSVSGYIALTLISEPWLFKPNGPSVYIMAAWFLASMAIQCYYSSNLIASFSIPGVQRPVITLEDSKELGKTVLVKRGSTVSLFLHENCTKANVKFVNQSDTGAEALRDYNVVAARGVNFFRFEMLDGGHDLINYYISPKPFLNIFAGWIYSYNFKLNEPIDIIIQRVSAAGLIDFWFKALFRNGSRTNQMADTSPRDAAERALKSKDNPLTLHHLQVLFYFWAAGLLLATIIFGCELTCTKIDMNSFRSFFVQH